MPYEAVAVAELAVMNCQQNDGIAHAIVKDVSLRLSIHLFLSVCRYYLPEHVGIGGGGHII